MKMRKGFTLIELMIVIAIIAIIAAIAIPNLMRSRILANEANAQAAMRAYATAQVTFQVGKQGRLAINTTAGNTGYCDNFSNLYYGCPVALGTGDAIAADTTRNLALISQTFADSFLSLSTKPTTGDGEVGDRVAAAITPTNGTGPLSPDKSQAYQGYQFIEDPNFTTAAQFSFDFALVSYPGHSSNTGNNGYWINQQGVIWQTPLTPDTAGADCYDSIGKVTPSTGKDSEGNRSVGSWATL